jgi:hypothetical protein
VPTSAQIDWLLGKDNPSVRFLTLTRLLGRSQRSPEVREARAAIIRTGFVPALLALQQPEGCWAAADSFYTAKYRGSVWQLMMLAEHCADASDERVGRACEFILSSSQELESGGFSQKRAKRAGGGVPSEVIPCLTGNMVWSLLRLGYLGDERVERGIDWLVRYLRFDDGDSSPPADWPYNPWEMCYGRHSCLMGVVKGLKALAELPAERRSPSVRRTIADGVEFLLRHHVYRRSHNLRRIAKPGWTHFGFPRMYQTDVLEVMLVLRSLGVHDERMADALALIQSKRTPDGRWHMEDSFNGKFQVDVEKQGQASKWLTLHALWVLG